MKRFLVGALFVLAALIGSPLAEPVLHAQQVPYAGQTRFSNEWAAPNFGKWRLQASSGSTSAGSYSLTFPSGGYVTAGGNQSFTPFNTTTRITVGIGSVQETVTPTAVSGCGISSVSNCIVTATFSFAHGAGTPVVSGSGGLDEAMNVAHSNGGGLVLVDSSTQITEATIAASTALYNNTQIEALFGSSVPRYYNLQPSVLTDLATPATRSATAGSTQVISGTATGTFAASSYFACVTYVDQLGQESPCSASFSFTATASVAVNWASPAASTGAVGWIPYIGLTGTSTQYRVTPTAAQCTLSTVETIVPACAMGSAAVTPSPNTTSVLAPGYVVNTYRLVPNSATVYAYQPTHIPPICGAVPSNWGPWTATGGGTTTQVQVLGTVSLPAGCLNQIGKTLHVSGKIVGTTGASETPQILVQLGPTLTTGTPTTLCKMAETTAPGAAAIGINFDCYLTTNATGVTGTVMPNGRAIVQLQAGTTAGSAAVDTATAAITNDIIDQNTLYITFIGTSGTDTAEQLAQLTLEMP